MAIILGGDINGVGGVTLNPNMVWQERYAHAPVLQEVQMTLAGTPIVYTQAQQGGLPITLLALDDQGWLTKAMADAVQVLANSADTTPLNLNIGSEKFKVLFRHTDAPALNLRPLVTRAVPLPEDYFVGEIKLMTV